MDNEITNGEVMDDAIKNLRKALCYTDADGPVSLAILVHEICEEYTLKTETLKLVTEYLEKLEARNQQTIVDYQTFTTKVTPKALRNERGVGDYWSNTVKCLKCGDVIRSRNRHDFVECSCGNIAVDGGSWYLKRVGALDGYEELSEIYDDQGDG